MTTQTTAAEQRRRLLLCALLLVVLTLAVFAPVMSYGFLNFDDDVYVYANNTVRGGLAPDAFLASFTEPVSQHWHPLTMVSYQVDAQLFGINPAAFHRTNLLLHTLNVLLVFLLLLRMTGLLAPTFFVAALFAIHPLHVEPATWIASRKDLLSTLFWLLSIGAYLAYTQRRERWRFGGVASGYILGLLSKSIVVTLPFLLLLLDIWPLRRLNLAKLNEPEHRRHALPLLGEKLLLLPIGLLVLGVNALAQRSGGNFAAQDHFAWWQRLGNAAIAYCAYLRDTLVPVNLAPYYPLPLDGYPVWLMLACAAIVIALTVAAVLALGRYPAVTVGWLWFIGTLVPVIGIIQLGAQARADRYTYFPHIGLFIAVAFGFYAWAGTSPTRKRALAAAGVAALSVYTVLAMNQTQMWRTPAALYEHTLAVTNDNWLIHYNYGRYLEDAGDVETAAHQYRAAIEILPEHAASHNNLGAIIARDGDYNEASQHFAHAFASDPDNVMIGINYATVLVELGELDAAYAVVQQVVKRNPGDPRALHVSAWISQSIAEREAAKLDALQADPPE